eukprot:gene22386-1034_t
MAGLGRTTSAADHSAGDERAAQQQAKFGSEVPDVASEAKLALAFSLFAQLAKCAGVDPLDELLHNLASPHPVRSAHEAHVLHLLRQKAAVLWLEHSRRTAR